MTITVTFKNKNDKPKILSNVLSMQVGPSVSSPRYVGNDIKTAIIPSDKDIFVTYEEGTCAIAKNIFQFIEITD